MALVIVAYKNPDAVGLYCIVESHPYQLGPPWNEKWGPLSVVDITIALPKCAFAAIDCLQYVPPKEWPESEYKVRELVRVEGAPREPNTRQPLPEKKQRELETTK